MNTELFGAPLLALAMVVYALTEAKMDATDIADDKPIQHGEGWFRRVGVSLIAIAVVFFCVMPHTWASVAACALIGYGAFTAPFRYRLNALRKLPWWYMDDLDTGGNWYDETWWRVRLLLAGHRWRQLTDTEWEMMIDNGYAAKYEKQVARLAYAVETAALSAGIWLYYHQLN